MNKKGQEIYLMIFLICLGFILFITLWAYYDYINEPDRDCNKYNTYGYITEYQCNDFWEFFEGRCECLIIMEDGTKLPLDDFKTMAIKQPMVRE